MCGSRAMTDICFIYSFQHRFIGDLFMPDSEDTAVSNPSLMPVWPLAPPSPAEQICACLPLPAPYLLEQRH